MHRKMINKVYCNLLVKGVAKLSTGLPLPLADVFVQPCEGS